jgi:ABC-type branched-subunit amino acid transport system substrate-binding protein
MTGAMTVVQPKLTGSKGEIFMRNIIVATSLTIGLVGIALAQSDSIKVAYIEPLSGGGASVGDGGLKHFQFFAEQINTRGLGSLPRATAHQLRRHSRNSRSRTTIEIPTSRFSI